MIFSFVRLSAVLLIFIFYVVSDPAAHYLKKTFFDKKLLEIKKNFKKA